MRARVVENWRKLLQRVAHVPYQLLFIYLFFWPCHMAHGILVSDQGLNAGPLGILNTGLPGNFQLLFLISHCSPYPAISLTDLQTISALPIFQNLLLYWNKPRLPLGSELGSGLVLAQSPLNETLLLPLSGFYRNFTQFLSVMCPKS